MTLTANEFFLDGSRAADPVIEAQFFNRLKMRNGTFKRTRAARFREIEEAFGPSLRERASSLNTVLDVAVSSGVTTVEFAEFLTSIGARYTLTATDLFIDAWLVTVARGVRVLADRDGWPLQYDVGGVAFRSWVRRLDYATLGFIPRVAVHSAMRRRAAELIAKGKATPVRMVSPRLSRRDDIDVETNDIMTATPAYVGRFDLVRAANILNHTYFSEAELARALGNLKSYLRGPGALLLVTRTAEDGSNRGTLFELQEGGAFTAVARVRDGSEIEALALASH